MQYGGGNTEFDELTMLREKRETIMTEDIRDDTKKKKESRSLSGEDKHQVKGNAHTQLTTSSMISMHHNTAHNYPQQSSHELFNIRGFLPFSF